MLRIDTTFYFWTKQTVHILNKTQKGSASCGSRSQRLVSCVKCLNLHPNNAWSRLILICCSGRLPRLIFKIWDGKVGFLQGSNVGFFDHAAILCKITVLRLAESCPPDGYSCASGPSFVRNETAAILDIFQYRSQTSDFSIVYNLSLPAMWSGYVIVFRGCFRNRGCFRIAAVLRTTVPVPKWFVKQPRFWNRGCSNDGIRPTKPFVRPRHSTQTWHQTDTIHTVSS